MKITKLLYQLARKSNDVRRIKKGTYHKRVARRSILKRIMKLFKQGG